MRKAESVLQMEGRRKTPASYAQAPRGDRILGRFEGDFDQGISEKGWHREDFPLVPFIGDEGFLFTPPRGIEQCNREAIRWN
ncbi:hypothetical protein I4000191A8_01960 [Clostridia bacterium i40-0019-1A8]